MKEFVSLSNVAQFIPSDNVSPTEVVPLKILLMDEKSIDETIQIVVQYIKDAGLHGAPQVDMPSVHTYNIHTCTLKELCHHISVFLVTEAGWGSPVSNQVRGRCGFVTSRSRHLPVPGRPS